MSFSNGSTPHAQAQTLVTEELNADRRPTFCRRYRRAKKRASAHQRWPLRFRLETLLLDKGILQWD